MTPHHTDRPHSTPHCLHCSRPSPGVGRPQCSTTHCLPHIKCNAIVGVAMPTVGNWNAWDVYGWNASCEQCAGSMPMAGEHSSHRRLRAVHSRGPGVPLTHPQRASHAPLTHLAHTSHLPISQHSKHSDTPLTPLTGPSLHERICPQCLSILSVAWV